MTKKLKFKLIVIAASLLFCTSLVQAQEMATVTVTHNGKGKVLVNNQNTSTGTIPKGENVTFAIIPNNGYFIKEVVFNGVTFDGSLLSGRPVEGGNASSRYFYALPIMRDSKLDVVFAPQINSYQMIILRNEGGTILANEQNVQSMMIGDGEMVLFRMSSNYGYSMSVFFNGAQMFYQANGWTTFTSPPITRNSIIEAVFAKGEVGNEIAATISHNEGGKVLLDGEEIFYKTYSRGSNRISMTIVPNDGMKVTGLSLNGIPYLIDPDAINSHDFSNCHFDMNFDITFGKDSHYEVTASCSEGGDVLINYQNIPAETIKEGDLVLFSIIPEKGYSIQDVNFNGKSVMDDLALFETVPGSSALYISPAIAEVSDLNVVFAENPISTEAADGSAITIYAASGKVIVENAAVGESISIYSPTGVCLKAVQASNSRTEIELPAGVYIVKAGKKTAKTVL